MRIAVTGGTGFIGQYLLREYCSDNQFVVATKRDDTTGLIQNKNITYIKSDYSEDSFTQIFSGCDAAVHMGAKRIDDSMPDTINSFFENIVVSENLFKALAELNIKNVVNISSRSVYGNGLSLPFREEFTSPISNYAISKLCVENIASLFVRKYAMKIKSLRVSQVLGYGERGGFMLAIFLENSLKGNKLSVYGDGKQARDYIYVKDVVAGVMTALKAVNTSGVFNLGSGTATSNEEIAAAYCQVFENNAGYELLTDKVGSSENTLLDMTKSKKDLGIEIKYSFKSALEDMKKIMSDCGAL